MSQRQYCLQELIMLFNTGEFNRRTTVITWGFHVCGSHCPPHINSFTVAGFLSPEHLPALHLEEGEGIVRVQYLTQEHNG